MELKPRSRAHVTSLNFWPLTQFMPIAPTVPLSLKCLSILLCFLTNKRQQVPRHCHPSRPSWTAASSMKLSLMLQLRTDSCCSSYWLSSAHFASGWREQLFGLRTSPGHSSYLSECRTLGRLCLGSLTPTIPGSADRCDGHLATRSPPPEVPYPLSTNTQLLI